MKIKKVKTMTIVDYMNQTRDRTPMGRPTSFLTGKEKEKARRQIKLETKRRINEDS